MSKDPKQKIRELFRDWYLQQQEQQGFEPAMPKTQTVLLGMSKKLSAARELYEELKSEYERECHKLQTYVEQERVWLAAHGMHNADKEVAK